MTANVAVFAVSAFFHELLISVPCHVLRLWAFLAMMYVTCVYVRYVLTVVSVVLWGCRHDVRAC